MGKYEDALNAIKRKSHYSFDSEIAALSDLVERNKVIKPHLDTDNFLYLQCSVCGALVAYTDRFCGCCGQRLKEDK